MDNIKEKLFQHTMIAYVRFIESYNEYKKDITDHYLYYTMSVNSSYLSACVDMLNITDDYNHYREYIKTTSGQAFMSTLHNRYVFKDEYLNNL